MIQKKAKKKKKRKRTNRQMGEKNGNLKRQ